MQRVKKAYVLYKEFILKEENYEYKSGSTRR